MNLEREDMILRLFVNAKHIFLGALSILFVSAVSVFPAAASGFTGSLDTVSDNQISGWAWNEDDAGDSPEIMVTVTNAAGETVQQFTDLADTHRCDLAMAGKGSGEYGFAVTPDWSALEDGVYTVRAYVDGNELPGTRQYAKGQAVPGNPRSLGVFKLTAYCPCSSCSEGWGRNTSTGAMAAANHTIAVDPRVIPYGSKILINGIVYTAEDKGGGVRGNHIDIFYNTHQEARALGTRYQEVFLVD